MNQPTLLDCPEGYAAAEIDAISAEDDFSRGKVSEALVAVLAGHLARRIDAIVIPEGVVKIDHINSGRWDEPDPLAFLVERLQVWTLVTNYAHYCICADGLTMFAGNFEEYVYGFQFDARTGSPADTFFRDLFHSNRGWQR